jgi:hypothetical protein
MEAKPAKKPRVRSEAQEVAFQKMLAARASKDVVQPVETEAPQPNTDSEAQPNTVVQPNTDSEAQPNTAQPNTAQPNTAAEEADSEDDEDVDVELMWERLDQAHAAIDELRNTVKQLNDGHSQLNQSFEDYGVKSRSALNFV